MKGLDTGLNCDSGVTGNDCYSLSLWGHVVYCYRTQPCASPVKDGQRRKFPVDRPMEASPTPDSMGTLPRFNVPGFAGVLLSPCNHVLETSQR